MPIGGYNAADEQTTTVAAPAVGLPEDVPCIGCGYNLRGLDARGRCPECGAALYPSVIRHRNRRRPQPPPDPRWARQVAEGAVLSLLAFALLLVLVMAPPRWFIMPYRFAPASASPGRAALLGVAAAAWVLAWYSAWKLTSQPPFGEAPMFRRRAAWGRWSLTAYLICPFLAPAFGENMSGPMVLTVLALFLAGIVGGAFLMRCVAGLFRRIDRAWAAQEATALTVLNTTAAVFAFLVPRGHGGVSSLDLMLDLAIHPYGTPDMLRDAVRDLVQTGRFIPVLIGFLVLALWNVALVARLLAAYLPRSRAAAREGAGNAPSLVGT